MRPTLKTTKTASALAQLWARLFSSVSLNYKIGVLFLNLSASCNTSHLPQDFIWVIPLTHNSSKSMKIPPAWGHLSTWVTWLWLCLHYGQSGLVTAFSSSDADIWSWLIELPLYIPFWPWETWWSHKHLLLPLSTLNLNRAIVFFSTYFIVWAKVKSTPWDLHDLKGSCSGSRNWFQETVWDMEQHAAIWKNMF